MRQTLYNSTLNHSARIAILMSTFDFVIHSVFGLQAKVHEAPLLFAVFGMIIYWMVISYYYGQARKVSNMFSC